MWDYPRPPVVEPTPRRIEVVLAGTVIADTTRALRVLETSHPPVYYIPADDVDMRLLERTPHRTVCEFKGVASYFSLTDGDAHVSNAAWTYEQPLPGYETIAGHIAFYAGALDEARVDGELVQAQEGHFYGG